MSFIDKIVALAKSEGVNTSDTLSDKQADAGQEQSKSTENQADKDESQAPPKAETNTENSTEKAETVSTESKEEKTFTEAQVQEMLKSREKEWNKSLSTDEQQRLENMSKDEQIAKLQQQVNRSNMKDVVFAKLEEAGLPVGVEKLVVYKDTAEETLADLTTVIDAFNVALEHKWNTRFAGKTPNGLGNAQVNINSSASIFEQTLQKEFKR